MQRTASRGSLAGSRGPLRRKCDAQRTYRDSLRSSLRIYTTPFLPLMDISFPSAFRRLWPAALLSGAVAVALFIPAAWVEDIPSPPEPLLHLLMFSALTGVWLYALPRWRWFVTAAGVFAAFATEALQAVAAMGRTAALDDLIANLLGVGVAWAVARWWSRSETEEGSNGVRRSR